MPIKNIFEQEAAQPDVLAKSLAEIKALHLNKFKIVPKQSQEHRGRKANRVAWQIFTDADLGGKGLIGFWVNPSQTQWTIKTRTAIEACQAGAIHYEWRLTGFGDIPGQKFELPVLNIRFESGYIGPDPDFVNASSAGTVPSGLVNFYDFIHLINQPTIFPNGAANYVNIIYHSALHPTLYLRGFFTPEGVTWADNSDDPARVTSWNASFVVFNSWPKLHSSPQQRAFWRMVLEQQNFAVMF